MMIMQNCFVDVKTGFYVIKSDKKVRKGNKCHQVPVELPCLEQRAATIVFNINNQEKQSFWATSEAIANVSQKVL